MRLRSTFVAATLAIAIVSAAAPAPASHAWEGFHWARPSNPVKLEIVDSMVGKWDKFLPLVSQDWTKSTVLDTVVTAGPDGLADRFLCQPIHGKIRACNAPNPNVTWLGLATVWTDDGHITQATTQVNDAWFDTPLYDDDNARRHVLCQEIGHDFGLDHQYMEPTCMDDVDGLMDPGYVSPGMHDFEQLELIYEHLDGAGCTKKCPTETARSSSANVRTWHEDGLIVFQFVIRAEKSTR